MVDMDTYLHSAAIALAVPFVITMTVSTIKGSNKPFEFAQYLFYGHPGRLMVQAEIEQGFYEFTGYYFGAIGAVVSGLMVYNLLKMFGLDEVIDTTVKEFLEWFTDTDAIVGSKGDVAEDEEEDEDPDANRNPEA